MFREEDVSVAQLREKRPSLAPEFRLPPTQAIHHFPPRLPTPGFLPREENRLKRAGVPAEIPDNQTENAPGCVFVGVGAVTEDREWLER